MRGRQLALAPCRRRKRGRKSSRKLKESELKSITDRTKKNKGKKKIKGL